MFSNGVLVYVPEHTRVSVDARAFVACLRCRVSFFFFFLLTFYTFFIQTPLSIIIYFSSCCLHKCDDGSSPDLFVSGAPCDWCFLIENGNGWGEKNTKLKGLFGPARHPLFEVLFFCLTKNETDVCVSLICECTAVVTFLSRAMVWWGALGGRGGGGGGCQRRPWSRPLELAPSVHGAHTRTVVLCLGC